MAYLWKHEVLVLVSWILQWEQLAGALARQPFQVTTDFHLLMVPLLLCHSSGSLALESLAFDLWHGIRCWGPTLVHTPRTNRTCFLGVHHTGTLVTTLSWHKLLWLQLT